MMFRFIRSVAFMVCVSFCLLTFPAYAEVSIAVVDIEKILSKSTAAVSVKEQVDTKREGFIGEVKSAEEKLRADQKSIETQRADLSKEELLKKAQEFEKGRIEARNAIQARKAALDKSYAEAMNTLTASIFEVCQTIANEDKIDLIITRQNIIIGSMSLDITDQVMERLNKKLPKLSLGVE